MAGTEAVVGALLALLPFAARAPQEPAGHAVEARVDPRVELFSLIFRLAGSPEYSQARVESYAADADAWFGEHRDHAVVRLAQELRAREGVSYDAVMSLAVHVADAEALEPVVPLWPRPEALDARWKRRDVERFLREARRFASESDFAGFLARHAELYRTAEARMQAVLDEHARLDWFDRFFGERPAARFALSLGMLNGGACYGPRVRMSDGGELLHCILGVWLTDEEGAPRFDASVLPTVVHEFCHGYCNALVDAHADELEGPAAILWQHVAERMRSQAYANPLTMMRESLVRACVVRYRAAGGEGARAEQIRAEHDQGFSWVGELSDVLADYERRRRDYATLADFMPEVVAFFEGYAPRFEEQRARVPRVVSTVPANGAEDVDPALEAIVVTFDRPMLDGAWSFVGGGPSFPRTTGPPTYDEERRVLTLPVELEPARSYELWLNRGRSDAFQSREGVKLEPYHVAFRTRGGARR